MSTISEHIRHAVTGLEVCKTDKEQAATNDLLCVELQRSRVAYEEALAKLPSASGNGITNSVAIRRPADQPNQGGGVAEPNLFSARDPGGAFRLPLGEGSSINNGNCHLNFIS